MKVAFVSTDWAAHRHPPQPNGCTHYRCVLPGHALGRIGWSVAIGLPDAHPVLGLTMGHERGMLSGFDVTVLKLVMADEALNVMHRTRGRVVVDVDDLHQALPETNIAHRTTDPLHHRTNNRAIYEQIIRAADTVTVSTEYLFDWYSARCRDVRLVRNGIEAGFFHRTRHDREPVIGWVGGTLWRTGDLRLLRDWLPQFAREKRVRVHHSGHIPNDPLPFSTRVGVPATTTPLRPVSRYPSLLTPLTIGLVPLTRHPFSEAKSGLKGLEYAAAGVPFIASPTREYQWLHRQGIGRLAGSASEWWDHATELLDPAVRSSEADRQHRLVMEHHTMRERVQGWASALSG